MNDFSDEKYLDVLHFQGFDAAEKYRINCLPNKLYKFIPLFDEKCEDKKRLDAFENGQIWFSSNELLNDPYENSGFYMDDSIFLKYGFQKDVIIAARKLLMESWLSASFTTNDYNNLPMWSHYANNYKGICIEYNVIDKSKIHKVGYHDERIDISEFYAFLLSESSKMLGSIDYARLNHDNMMKYAAVISSNAFYKHTSWNYEQEYRIVQEKLDAETGRLILCDDIGLKPHKVFCGVGCNQRNKNELKRIAKKIGCGYFCCSLSEHEYTFLTK